jgi:Fe-Mn family superoxide dismutase
MKSIKLFSVLVALIFLSSAFVLINSNPKNVIIETKNAEGKFIFPDLPYSYEALEPHIDKMTMEIHYSKHHQTYFNNFIKSIEGTELEKMSIEDMFKKISKLPVAVRNNGGGYYNHILYWQSMCPEGGGHPEGVLLGAIHSQFGGFEEFKIKFSDAAKSRFGSGWVWLSVDENGKLFISSTPNQDNPLMDVTEQKGTPILAFDVWEHAYYLKFQNRRTDYIEAFWMVVDWKNIEKRYNQLMEK